MHYSILITGKPGLGKTTAIRSVVDKLGRNRAGGFWSVEIREHGRRVGFAIETLDGQKGILAHTSKDSGPRVGRYRVNIEDIKGIAVPSMRSARNRGKIIIIDEIAKMELFSVEFRCEVIRCLGTRRVIGTLQARENAFLNALREREDTLTIELTQANRDQIPQTVLTMIGQSDA